VRRARDRVIIVIKQDVGKRGPEYEDSPRGTLRGPWSRRSVPDVDDDGDEG
jgi:hypothetical protein